MSKGSYFDLKIRIPIDMMVAEANLGPAASYIMQGLLNMQYDLAMVGS